MEIWYNNRYTVIIPLYGQGDTLAAPAPAPMANDTSLCGWGDMRHSIPADAALIGLGLTLAAWEAANGLDNHGRSAAIFSVLLPYYAGGADFAKTDFLFWRI